MTTASSRKAPCPLSINRRKQWTLDKSRVHTEDGQGGAMPNEKSSGPQQVWSKLVKKKPVIFQGPQSNKELSMVQGMPVAFDELKETLALLRSSTSLRLKTCTCILRFLTWRLAWCSSNKKRHALVISATELHLFLKLDRPLKCKCSPTLSWNVMFSKKRCLGLSQRKKNPENIGSYM